MASKRKALRQTCTTKDHGDHGWLPLVILQDIEKSWDDQRKMLVFHEILWDLPTGNDSQFAMENVPVIVSLHR